MKPEMQKHKCKKSMLSYTFVFHFSPAKLALKSGIPKNPYFSHTCKFDVFPCHDQNRKDEIGEFEFLIKCTAEVFLNEHAVHTFI